MKLFSERRRKMSRYLLMLSHVVVLAACNLAEAGFEFTRVVDTNTRLPGSTSLSFAGFGATDQGPAAYVAPSMSGKYIGFQASGQTNLMGVYVSDGSSLSRIADTNTSDPSGGT